MGRKFFPMRVVRPWHRLPRAAVDAPSLEMFKTGLGGALGYLAYWKVSWPMAERWNWIIFKVLSNPKQSVILWCSLGSRPWSLWPFCSAVMCNPGQVLVVEAEGGCRCFQEQHPEVLNHLNCPLERLCFYSCSAFHTEEQTVGGGPWRTRRAADWLLLL